MITIFEGKYEKVAYDIDQCKATNKTFYQYIQEHPDSGLAKMAVKYNIVEIKYREAESYHFFTLFAAFKKGEILDEYKLREIIGKDNEITINGLFIADQTFPSYADSTKKGIKQDLEYQELLMYD